CDVTSCICVHCVLDLFTICILTSFCFFSPSSFFLFFFFFNATAPTEIYTLSLHDALPISGRCCCRTGQPAAGLPDGGRCLQASRSEEHTSELQSQSNLVCRLLLEKKKKKNKKKTTNKQSKNSTIINTEYA